MLCFCREGTIQVLERYQRGSVEVPERFRRGAGEVLERSGVADSQAISSLARKPYLGGRWTGTGEGSGEVLQRYQRGAGEVLERCARGWFQMFNLDFYRNHRNYKVEGSMNE